MMKPCAIFLLLCAILFGVSSSLFAAQPPPTAEQARQHWAFQAVRKPVVPATNSRAQPANPVDNFIWAKLAEKRWEPAVPASRAELVRRIYFDVIGLPPTPEQVSSFLADNSPKAYERL